MNPTRRPIQSRVDSGISRVKRFQPKERNTTPQAKLSPDELVQLPTTIQSSIDAATRELIANQSGFEAEFQRTFDRLRGIVSDFQSYFPSLQDALTHFYRIGHVRAQKEEQLRQDSGVAQLTELQAHHHELQVTFEGLASNYKQLQNDHTQLLEEYTHAELLSNQLAKSMATLQAEHEHTTHQYTSTKHANEKLDTRMNIIRPQIADLQRSYNSKLLQIQSLRESVQTRMNELLNKCTAIESDIEKFTDGIKEMDSRIAQKQLEVDDLQELLARLQDETTNTDPALLQERLDSQLEHNTRLQALIEQRRDERKQLQDLNSTIEEQIEAKQKDILVATHELSAARDRLSHLESTLQEYSAVINQHSENERQLKASRDALHTQFHSQRETLLQEESTLCDQNTAKYEETLSTYDNLVESHLDEIRQLKQSHEEEIHELTTTIEVNKQTVKDYARKKITLERESQAFTAKIAEVESRLAMLKENKDAEYDHIRKEYFDLQNQYRSLDYEYERLQSQRKEQLQKKAEFEQLEYESNQLETYRRQLHNLLQDLRGSIRVLCRIRPLMRHDNETEYSALRITGDHQQCLSLHWGEKERDYQFDTILGPDSTQEQVFDEVSSIVQSAIDGYNVCLFSYGQTGSGKTHTMTGNPEMPGIIPRSVDLIFSKAQELTTQGWNASVTVSCCQIYNEKINDLLQTSSSASDGELKILNNTQKRRITVQNLTSVGVTTSQEVENWLKIATKNRTTAKTGMNEQSSRSHFIFTLTIQLTNTNTHEQRYGTLNLCDLAGSERIKSANTSGDSLTETKNINTSLSMLGKVFLQLAAKEVPTFRNSRLTELLQYCLSGEGKTMMIVNLSPTTASAQETSGSLQLAKTVSLIQNGKTKKNTTRRPPSSAHLPAAGANSSLNLSANKTTFRAK